MTAAADLQFQLKIDGVWTDVPGYEAEGWQINVGPSATSGAQANGLDFTINNDSLDYDPQRVESSLYGKIGLNTPGRLLLDGEVLLAGEAASWEPDRTVDHVPGENRGRSQTDIRVESVLRRLGKWDDQLQSAIARQTNSISPLYGYWRLEDPTGATSLANDVPGGLRGLIGGASLQANDGPGGSDKVATVPGGDGAYMSGRFAPSTGSGWQICWAAQLAQLTSSTYQNLMWLTDTAGREWLWQVSTLGFQWQIKDPQGNVIETLASGFGAGVDPTDWIRYRIHVTVSGSTVTYAPAWYSESTGTYGVTDTFSSSTTGRPSTWLVTSLGAVDLEDAAFGHVFATSTTPDLLDADAIASFTGFNGETAGNRFVRILTENGFNAATIGDPDLSPPMGPQKPDKILPLLQLCADTDAGLIFDDPTEPDTCLLRLNNSMINQLPAMALTYGVDVYPPLKKKIDDQSPANDITATNYDGTSVRVADETGPLGTAPPPTGVGRYTGKLDVSLTWPDALADRAGWELANNTLNRARYEALNVDLLGSPEHRDAARQLLPGDLVTLDGLEYATIPLLVINFKRTGNSVPDKLTINCVPAELYLGGVFDDGLHRYDAASVTLSAATSSATSLTFNITDPLEQMSTTSAYDLLVVDTGEIIGIGSGDVAARAGTGPWTQAATGVDRGKNGITRAIPAGAKVRVADRGYYALKGSP